MEIDIDQGCVLVVDDQESELLIIQEALSSYYKVITTTSSLQAIDLAQQHQPDVILLDIDMPDMNGFELCQALQALPAVTGASFIFITSHTDLTYESKALKLGAADFIPKPIHLEICRLRVKNQIIVKQQSLALHRAFKKLHHEKEHLNTILLAIGDGVIATDPKERVSFMNPVAERLTGWTEKEAFGKPITDIMQLRDATTNTEMVNPLHIALEQKRTVAMAINAKITSHDGMEYRVEDTASPIFEPVGHKLIGGVIVFQDVTDRVAMSTQMTHLTNHDQLTGLPNRVLLHDRMLQAINNVQNTEHLVAVLLVDLDNFKYLNDSLGHQAGDSIIIQFARRLEALAQTHATVSRIGGDEFVLLLPNCKSVQQINQVAGKLIEVVKAPLVIDGEEHRLSVSMGISIYPEDAKSPEEMMRHADTAMYKVKSAGRNGFAYYSEELFNGMKERVDVEKLLHRRLAENDILVYFQPKYCLSSRSITGLEALARMKDSDGNLMPPDLFIPVAEEAGLIIQLGNMVLEKSCKAAKDWLLAGNPTKIAVNIGASQFNDSRFTATVADILLKHQLPAKYLELEITETALIENINSAKKAIQQLQKIGVTIALDDFGTGYSSLSYLRSFNFNVLKIDRTFVMDIDSDEQARSIIKAIVNLAQSLKLNIVCEGIETQAQLEFLSGIGCQEGQGYYFTRPLPLAEIEVLMSAPE